MNKPNNYEETKVGGDFTPIELGGHHLVIKQVNETKSKAGADMLVVLFDFAKNDKQPGYMSESFKNDIRPEKKWPHNGTTYILCEDKDGNCSKKFKSFITAFENSNNVEAIWGEKFATQFKNKKIGGVFGEVENEYNGKVSMRRELRWFCDDSRAEGANIPDAKLLGNMTPAAKAITDDFMKVEDTDEEEIPWG